MQGRAGEDDQRLGPGEGGFAGRLQVSPGVTPPLGCVSTACALSIAVLTTGRAGANGGPRTVTIASGGDRFDALLDETRGLRRSPRIVRAEDPISCLRQRFGHGPPAGGLGRTLQFGRDLHGRPEPVTLGATVNAASNTPYEQPTI